MIQQFLQEYILNIWKVSMYDPHNLNYGLLGYNTT
jgi:hypothetical protein